MSTRIEEIEDTDAAFRWLLNELVDLRKNSGLRQVDVAERMGIGQPSVSELERGTVVPKVTTLLKYAKAVGADINIGVTGGEANEQGDVDTGS